MRLDDIRAAIKADDELRQLAHDGNDAELAKRIEISEVREHRLTTGAVLDLLGPLRGGEVMAGLRKASGNQGQLAAALSEVIRMMDKDGVNLTHRDSKTVLLMLVQGELITADEAKQIGSLAIQKLHPSVDEVSRALKPWRPEGKANQLVME